MIHRALENIIQDKLARKKVLIIYGARQVGKTSLINYLFENKDKTLWLNGEDSSTRNMFETISTRNVSMLFSGTQILIIDEAQNILNIGLQLKIIHDTLPDLQIIATGSSSFDLANKINEPLTGRKLEYKMFPLSFSELVEYHGLFEEKAQLNHRLIYGYYPEVVCNPADEKEILNNLTSSYLYKDILLWENLKKSDRIFIAIAAQASASASAW